MKGSAPQDGDCAILHKSIENSPKPGLEILSYGKYQEKKKALGTNKG